MSQQSVRNFLEKTNGLDRFLLLFVLIGISVSLISLFRGIVKDRQVQVEFLSGDINEKSDSSSVILVDIEGAVINPGVYELKDGSRIKDVLIMSGGMSQLADRVYCERNINLAETLKDGQKIFVPYISNTDTEQGYAEPNSNGNLISINTATIEELDTLWGIGASRAESIVKNRPYQNLDELISKGVLTKSIVDQNRDKMSLY